MLPDAEFQEYLDFARGLATEAGALATAHARRHRQVQRKLDGTLVTQTDRELDRLTVQRIGAAFPDHAVLSEEQATVYDPAWEYTWVVDPLDGTTNFAWGMPIWGVSLALLVQGQPVVAAVDFPLLDERYSSARGAGAYCNELPLHTETQTWLDDQHLFTQCTRTPKRLVVDIPLKARMLGSAAYHCLKVADGSTLAGLEATPKLWDIAGAYLVVREAGGWMTDLDGNDVFPLPAEKRDYARHSHPILVAANRHIRDQMLASVRVR